MLQPGEIDLDPRDRHPLFGKKDAHPARVRREIGVVEFHRFLPPKLCGKPKRPRMENPPATAPRQPLVNPLDSIIRRVLRCVPGAMSESRAESGTGGRRDPQVAARRRRMSLELRRARQKLTGPEAAPPHSVGRMRLFAQIHRSAAPMLGLVALGTAAVALRLIGAAALATWAVFIGCAIGLVYALPLAFLDNGEADKSAGAWRRKFVLGDGLLRIRLDLSHCRAPAVGASRTRRPSPCWSCCWRRPSCRCWRRRSPPRLSPACCR